MDKNEKILYTVKEVAAILRTNVDFVYKLVKSKKIKCIKLGQYKIRKEWLIDFLENNEGLDFTNPNAVARLD